ncbi:putative pectinesterasepectinesterase inhibitor 7, partial [Nicotiana attenuata]
NASVHCLVVRNVVIVNQDGSMNFSTITDAVAAAPNDSMSTSGYFLKYITAGIYEEYVSIAKTTLCTPRQF